MSENSLIVKQPGSTKINLDVIQAAIREWRPLMKELIIGGRKLTDEQIDGRLMFAAVNDLNPFTEVHTITDASGKTMAHCMAINGLRRKNQEQVGPSVEIMTEFVEITGEALKKFPGALIGYECRLRDGQSYTQWQRRMVEIGKAAREAMGNSLTFQELIALTGPAPVYVGIGIFYQDELNAYKDKNFNPAERAKKRAEVNARHHRWPTETPIYDGAPGDVIEGAYQDEKQSEPEKPQVESTPAEIISVLYNEPRSPDWPIELAPEDHEPIVESPAAPAPAVPAPMSLETAEAVTNSDGVRYGDLDSVSLSHMTIGIGKGLKKADLTPEQREEYQYKLAAIKTILSSRNKKEK